MAAQIIFTTMVITVVLFYFAIKELSHTAEQMDKEVGDVITTQWLAQVAL